MVLSIFKDVIQKALLVMIRRCALDDLGVKIAEALVRSWRVEVLSYSLTSVSGETRDRTPGKHCVLTSGNSQRLE